MACGTNNYFVGNGEVLVRRRADDCGDPSEGYRKLGDANTLMVNISQDFGNHYESTSGNRVRSARWLNQTEANFTLSVQNFDAENLADLLLGTDSGAVAGAAVVGEVVPDAYLDRWVFTEFPGISAVSVTSDSGGNVLVLDTDYELDTRNGGIKIIDMTDVVDNSIEVDYTHVGIEGLIEALTTNPEDFQVRFNGINLNSSNKPVIVTLKRAQFNATEELSLIGQEITELSFTGALLPDENSEFFDILLSNQVA